MIGSLFLAVLGNPKPCPHLHLPKVRPGITTRSSEPQGRHGKGRLLRAARLPMEGKALAVMPGEHRNRRRTFAATELANALQIAAEELQTSHPAVVTYIGDISGAGGGSISGHSSHEIGLDVDVAFFYRNAAGDLVAPDFMWHVGEDGLTVMDAPEPMTLDPDLTWAFLYHLMTSAQVEVQWAFVSRPVKSQLLAAAQRAGAPPEIVRRAETILHQLTKGAPHDDHLHIRVYCPPSDWETCFDTGPVWDWVVQPPPVREDLPVAAK